MFINIRQEGNGKLYQHQLNPVSEPNSSTRANFGALRVTTVFTGPVKGKETNNRENRNGQEDKVQRSKNILLGS